MENKFATLSTDQPSKILYQILISEIPGQSFVLVHDNFCFGTLRLQAGIGTLCSEHCLAGLPLGGQQVMP